jgi:hypothetical protein
VTAFEDAADRLADAADISRQAARRVLIAQRGQPTTPENPHIWGYNVMLSAWQVRAMPAELVKRSLVVAIEEVERKARDHGVADPAAFAMFLVEHRYEGELDE